MYKPSKNEIKVLYDKITDMQRRFKYIGEMEPTIDPSGSIQIMEVCKLSLCFAYEELGLGFSSSLLNDGDSLLPLMMFDSNAKGIIYDLIRLLRNKSPFSSPILGDEITPALIRILETVSRTI